MIDDTPDTLAPKPWWESRAVWGGILAAVSPAVAALGYRIDLAAAADILAALLSAVGGLLAVVGRIRGTRPIRSARAPV